MIWFEKMYNPTQTQEALALLQKEENVAVIAGGTDMMIALQKPKYENYSMVCIRDISEMKGIQLEEDGSLYIGAATSFSEIEANPLVLEHFSLLACAVGQIGGPQIRNMATIGGNLCEGAVSADSVPSLLVADAELEIGNGSNQKTLSVHEFHLAPGKVKLEKGDLLLGIRIPKAAYDGFYGHYIKYSIRKAMDIATLGCAVNVKLTKDKKRLQDVKIAFAVAAPTPIRCFEAEKRLCGAELNAELERSLYAHVVQELQPRTSWRASKEFRLHLAREMSSRALEAAVKKSGGVWKK